MEQDPKDFYKSGISDHAPTLVSLLFEPPLPAGEGAIPTEFFQHKLYAYFLDCLCWEEKFDDTVFEDPLEHLPILKTLMKVAANFTRDHMQALDEGRRLYGQLLCLL